VVVSGIFFHQDWTPARRFQTALAFAAVCAVLGLALRSLGISKIRATPSWALWSVAGATALFALFYFLLDVRQQRGWALPFRAPGSNTLLTYLLPDLTYYALAFAGLSRALGRWNNGATGVVRSLAFTAVMLGLSFVLTRARVRMQL
jgi:heparan-alpha-glucosaminide N-acetyltransferase